MYEERIKNSKNQSS